MNKENIDTENVTAEEKDSYEIVGVRFKDNGKTYYFDPQGTVCTTDDKVIVETARGLEFGYISIANRIVDASKVVLPLRPVIRIATPADIERYNANKDKEKEAFAICEEKIATRKLEMKLVDVEYTFDNTKLIFYFTADGRIDFRELVKDLAAVFKTRIELRQIGIRDETKLIGGLGVCGRPFCCKKFLPDFVQVSIKMAKEQNLSLNSQKISGACGRLMCCLRYEHEVYEEELKKTPKLDSEVMTPDGIGTVCEVNPLAGLVKVRLFEAQTVKQYSRDDVKQTAKKNSSNETEEKASDNK